ncbi:ribosome recycling factor [bacterium SCSIO 12741]|nr:ribosome recycling factor [bacterium SCSIO 12741]
MEEELGMVYDMAKDSMNSSLDHLKKELLKIRAGKATPGMLDGIMVEYYGSNTPLSQVSNVNTPDARMISIQPWEKQMLDPIEKAIINSNLGFNPQNNGEMIIINIPPLTEERRRDLVKQAKAEGEKTKVSVRSFRKEANDELKKLKNDGLPEDMAKDGEEEIQSITNAHINKVDKLIEEKEADIMSI